MEKDTKRFARPVNTGSNHTVLVLESAWDEDVREGDELAAYDKEGNITSNRVVTHNEKSTKELRELYPELQREIKRITEESIKPRRESTNTSKMFPDKNVWRMMFQLGKG